MEHQPTAEDARIALRSHVEDRALEARRQYGEIDWAAMQRMLGDSTVVRFPTEIRFDAGPLESGEFAYPQQLGDRPEQGFHLIVHPAFAERHDVLPLLVAYQLVRINYGEIVTHEEAELFGAKLLGLDPDDYYRTLCELVDGIPAGA
ncbi:MAG: hypothetical protein GY716_06025 [bacterium]|nr:hypothetical protein [bacterium]